MALRLGRAQLAALAALALGLFPAAANAAVGDITEFNIPTAASGSNSMDVGPDGNLWFTEYDAGKIARVTADGTITEFTPPGAPRPSQVANGPDGNVWYTDFDGNAIEAITTGGTFVNTYTLPSAFSDPYGIVAGLDGNLWFTENAGNRIGRITTSGTITEFTIPTAGANANGIAAGADGALWFAEYSGNKIGRITLAGAITEFPVGGNPGQTARGPDGNIWFTEYTGDKIGRITPAGAVTEFPVTAGGQPHEMVAGPDGSLWFTESGTNLIGRLTMDGRLTEFPVPTAASFPEGIRVGPDGQIWFTESSANKVGRVVTQAPPIARTDAAANVTQTAADLVGAVNPQGATTTVHFEYGTTDAYGSSTPNVSVGGSEITDQTGSATITGLSPGTTYHYRLLASNAKGSSVGADATFTTTAAAAPPAAPVAPPRPVFARVFAVTPVSGSVLVKVPGTTQFVALTEPAQVQVGSIIDTRHGRVRITIADKNGKLWSSDFYEGLFQITQLAKDKGVANLKLLGGSFRSCGARSSRALAAAKGKSKKSVRHLWGDGKGPFRTQGGFASAAIRGTNWKTDDRCDGTLVKVKVGSVTVRDFKKRKSVVVRAGRQYLARR